MNDFTKEELQWLSHELQIIIRNFEHTHVMSMPIAKKIKYMIDNYCKTNGHVYQFSLGLGYCENCGITEVIEDIKEFKL